MQSPDENQIWCPGPSLWNLITEHVHGSEMAKIHTALGHSLVDMYTEVHFEAEMCYKLWQESQRGGNHGSRAGTSFPCQQGSPLSDPPAVKELVRAEVKMLLQTLRERASRGGRDGEELLLRYNPDTVNYALDHTESCFTTCPNPGETDNSDLTDNRIRPSSQCSGQSCIEDEIEAVRDKLNVTDIDQVVARLKSVMLEECEVLKRLVQRLKRNRPKSEFHKPEPTLVELRELRGAVQMDLELYPSSLSASSTDLFHLPVKKLKNKFRLSAGHMTSDETLQALTAASVLRPQPPPPLCHTNPKPPAGPPHNKMSASVRPIQTSLLSRTRGQHRRISYVTKSRETPVCNNITISEQSDRNFTNDQIIVECEHHCSLSLEQDGAGLHRRDPTSSPRFQIKTQRNSPVHEAQQSSHRSFQSLSKECDLSPHRERKGSASRLRNIHITPSHGAALTSLCGAGSYSSNSTDHSLSTTGKLKSQNGQHKSTCGGSLVSTAVKTDKDSIKIPSESFYSLLSAEPGSAPSPNYSRKSNNGLDSGHLGKDINQQQSLTNCSSHHPESNGEQGQSKCIHPVYIQINGQLSTSPKRPLGGITAQPKTVQTAKTGLEMIKFNQPFPPARVSNLSQ